MMKTNEQLALKIAGTWISSFMLLNRVEVEAFHEQLSMWETYVWGSISFV